MLQQRELMHIQQSGIEWLIHQVQNGFLIGFTASEGRCRTGCCLQDGQFGIRGFPIGMFVQVFGKQQLVIRSSNLPAVETWQIRRLQLLFWMRMKRILRVLSLGRTR